MQIIAFTGKMRSGKTVCSDYVTRLGYKKINFKDALISEMKENFLPILKVISSDYAFCGINELFKQKPLLIRKLMQCYATEVRRGDDEDYWVKKWISSIIDKELVVADDVRFLNEAEAIKMLGGTIIRVEREGFTGDSHSSETEMNKIKPDFTIKNNSTKDELYKKLELNLKNGKRK